MDQNPTENNGNYRRVLERGRERIGAVMGAEGRRGKVLITPANLLTLVRLAIIPLFWFTFLSHSWTLNVVATLLFSLGALTDLWDGRLARGRGEVTVFGNFMDPLVDKLLVLSAFWGILLIEDFGNWFEFALLMVILITIRETALTILRIRGLSSGSAVVTSFWGKLKTTVQLVTLIAGQVAFNVRDILFSTGHPLRLLEGDPFLFTLLSMFALSTLTTLVSGALYIRDIFFLKGGRG